MKRGSDQPLRTSSIRVDVERFDDAMEKLSELVVTRFRLSRAVNALRDQGVDVRELAPSSTRTRDACAICAAASRARAWCPCVNCWNACR